MLAVARAVGKQDTTSIVADLWVADAALAVIEQHPDRAGFEIQRAQARSAGENRRVAQALGCVAPEVRIPMSVLPHPTRHEKHLAHAFDPQLGAVVRIILRPTGQCEGKNCQPPEKRVQRRITGGKSFRTHAHAPWDTRQCGGSFPFSGRWFRSLHVAAAQVVGIVEDAIGAGGEDFHFGAGDCVEETWVSRAVAVVGAGVDGAGGAADLEFGVMPVDIAANWLTACLTIGQSQDIDCIYKP